MTAEQVLHSCDVLLLDMNSTFMFGEDRFGNHEDYHGTYRSLGGSVIESEDLHAAISALCEIMTRTERDPVRWKCFPQVGEVLADLEQTRGWGGEDLTLVEAVIAQHELGYVPGDYAAAVLSLSETHRVRLVSNLWSRPGPWVAELDRAGALPAFERLVFSSAGSVIKPAWEIFERALNGWSGPRQRVAMIGDSLYRDVGGAKRAGLVAVWIGDVRLSDGRPDAVVPDIRTASYGDSKV